MGSCSLVELVKEKILKLMKTAGYQPLNKSEMARAMEIPSSQRSEMRAALHKLEKSGQIVEGKKARYKLRAKTEGRLVGSIKFLKKGGALFFPDPQDETNLQAGLDLSKYEKVFIPSKYTDVALDGDRVLIQVRNQPPPRWQKHSKKHQERRATKEHHDDTIGKVQQILKRKTNNFIGLYMKRGKFKYVEPEDALLPKSMKVSNAKDATPGQVVVVQLISWENAQDTPLCEVIEVVGWPEDPGVDILSVIHKYRLQQEFPEEVVAEAKKAHESGVTEEEIARRIDWRDRLVLTIDPFDAKDFDDAIAVEKIDTGWRLGVHIADVSHYVREHTELDKEALRRGNSTYLVDRVLPMLPEELCNDICSLRPEVDRLTKCAVIEISEKGELLNWKLQDAVIHSKRRFSYEEAQEILEREPTGEIEEMVHEAWKMASVLRKRRFQHGSLDLDFPEIKVILDEKFVPQRVEKLVHDPSHKLIEECMLVANEVVAIALKRKKVNSIYRIHEAPDIGRLLEYAELAKSHGFEPGDLSNKKHVQKLIEDIKGHPSEQAVKIGLLKSLKRAAYSTEGLGHYGLGKEDYCHFTSPIRRYADLVVHRGVQSLLENRPEKPARLPKAKVLLEHAEHISETERTSSSAESETKKMKLMEYLYYILRDGNEKEFNGIVTECRKNGAFVEITDIHERGLVKIEDFPRGNWRLETGMHRYSASGGRAISLGQKVIIKLVYVDIERQLIDLKITKYNDNNNNG